MTIYRRGKFYWYEFEFDGVRHRKSTKTTNQKAALQVEAAVRLALAKGEVGITEKKAIPSLAEAMKEFLSWSESEHHEHPETTNRYRYSSLALLRHFKPMTPIDKITPADVEEFKTKRSKEKGRHTKTKLRPATVNREVACLRAMFNHAGKKHSSLRNPISRQTGVKLLAENNQLDRVVSYTEQAKYLAAADPLLRDVATIIVEHGMRPEEVYTLRGEHVNVLDRYLRIVKGKTKAARRQIELNDTSIRILSTRIEKYGRGYLFPHGWDLEEPKPGAQRAHDAALAASGVAHFRLYDLRHTFATRAVEAGIDLVTLAAMMGHSRIQMVMRYAHPTQRHQASAAEKLVAHNRAAAAREQARLAEEQERQAGPKVVVLRRNA